MLVQMERQIDREIAADQKKLGVNDGLENQNGEDDDSDSDIEDEETVLMYGPVPQIVTNDLKSLDEMASDEIFFLISLLPSTVVSNDMIQPFVLYAPWQARIYL